MKIIQFLFSKLFLKNVGLAVIVAFLIFSIAFTYIKFYTFHGKALPVPDFYGMTKIEVTKLASKKKLLIEYSDSVYQHNVKKGTIVDQSPNPGFKVKKYRTIFLTINANQPEKVEMPDVVSVTLRQAKAILETSGLIVGKIRYVPDIAINNVIRQEHNGKTIQKGTIIEKGSYIDLILGNGYSSVKIPTPYLKGMNLRNAKNKLVQESLNIGSIIYDNSIVDYKDSVNATIWKQKPEAGNSSINMGASIDVWLTTDSLKILQIQE